MSTLLTTFLTFQNQVRIYHWRTHSYARHKASGHLYEDIDKLIDQFIEILQGKTERITYDQITIKLFPLQDEEMVELLTNFAVFLEEKVEAYLKKLGNSSDLKNIRDEMVGKVNQTKYLFTLQ